MFAYAFLLLVVSVGLILACVANRLIHGKFWVGSGWYLVLGLILALPFLDAPSLLMRSIAHPNPNIHEFLWVRTAFLCVGICLILRYAWLSFSSRRAGTGTPSPTP